MAEKNKYKFKALKCYKSTDWLTFDKKYRTVFIEQDTDWISAELTFYNVLFDEEDWQCQIKLECVKLLEGKEEKKPRNMP